MAKVERKLASGREVWKLEHRRCPICNRDEGEVVYHVPACDSLPECDVVTCNGYGDPCGFCFSDTPADQATFDRYYAVSKKYGEETTGSHGWNRQRYAETADLLTDLLPVPFDGVVLDVGGGEGGFISALRVRNIEAIRYDGMLWTTGKPYIADNRWHCVTLCHVLEHVRDLDGAMRNLSEIARTVYCEVPDADRYHEFCDSPWQQFNAEHVNHFTARHLRMLFERHGFEQVASGRGECGDPPPHMSPYVWGFFERRKDGAAISAYCDKSATLWRLIEAKVKAIDLDFVSWGAGQLHMKLRDAGLLGKCNLTLDHLASDKGTGGLTGRWWQMRPETFAETNNSEPILVTTIQHRESVLADIARLQLKNEVITLP